MIRWLAFSTIQQTIEKCYFILNWLRKSSIQCIATNFLPIIFSLHNIHLACVLEFFFCWILHWNAWWFLINKEKQIKTIFAFSARMHQMNMGWIILFFFLVFYLNTLHGFVYNLFVHNRIMSWIIPFYTHTNYRITKRQTTNKQEKKNVGVFRLNSFKKQLQNNYEM